MPWYMLWAGGLGCFFMGMVIGRCFAQYDQYDVEYYAGLAQDNFHRALLAERALDEERSRHANQ